MTQTEKQFKDMEKIIKEMATIRSSAANMRRTVIAALALCGAVCVGAVGLALHFVSAGISDIYVLDRGAAFSATASEGEAQRELEVQDHVSRFHDLLLNLSPSSEAIRSNIDRALTMSDRSVYNYWQDLSETGFYRRLISANISQQFSLDSLRTDMGTYPYTVHTWGKVYLMRETNITAYDIHTSCALVDVGRSKGNPHGLMIEQFTVVSNEKIGTRRRN